MLTKNIVVTITDDTEGTSISFKSTSDSTKVLLHGDMTTYDRQEVQNALQEVEKFIQSREGREEATIIVPAGTELVGCGMDCACSS